MLARMASTMAHNVTHCARPVLHVIYLHAYYTIIATRKHKAARTMITLILKCIGLVRRRPLDWDHPEHVTVTDPSHDPHGLMEVPRGRKHITGARWSWTARRMRCGCAQEVLLQMAVQSVPVPTSRGLFGSAKCPHILHCQKAPFAWAWAKTVPSLCDFGHTCAGSGKGGATARPLFNVSVPCPIMARDCSGMVRWCYFLAVCSGNATHAVCTQCEVLDVGKYSHPSYLLVVKH